MSCFEHIINTPITKISTLNFLKIVPANFVRCLKEDNYENLLLYMTINLDGYDKSHYSTHTFSSDLLGITGYENILKTSTDLARFAIYKWGHLYLTNTMHNKKCQQEVFKDVQATAFTVATWRYK